MTNPEPRSLLAALRADAAAITRSDLEARRAPLAPIRPSATSGEREPTEAWRDRAACVGLGAELFHPGPWDHAGRDQALAVCGECPVRSQCLRWALETDERFGIWGGVTERDRRRLRRALPRWSRCRGCGCRYLRTSPGQRYCSMSCRGITVKYRREVARDPGRRRSSRARQAEAS